ncbi:MAG: protein TonB, partial [Gammaproteobacteria bacterium]
FKMNDTAIVSEKIQLDIPLIQTDINISMTMPEASSDSDYIPVLKVAPIYPQRAANRNIEGYVVVEYTISSSGQVINVKVIEAKPKGVFDKSAIAAAKRFKYKPRKVDGKHVAVNGVKNKFTFVLEN